MGGVAISGGRRHCHKGCDHNEGCGRRLLRRSHDSANNVVQQLQEAVDDVATSGGLASHRMLVEGEKRLDIRLVEHQVRMHPELVVQRLERAMRRRSADLPQDLLLELEVSLCLLMHVPTTRRVSFHRPGVTTLTRLEAASLARQDDDVRNRCSHAG